MRSIQVAVLRIEICYMQVTVHHKNLSRVVFFLQNINEVYINECTTIFLRVRAIDLNTFGIHVFYYCKTL